MIKRLVLYSLIFCCVGSLFGSQKESVSLHQTAIKKIRAFFKSKKGQATLAVGLTLLGGTVGWYLRGRRTSLQSLLLQESRETDLFVAEALLFCKNQFGDGVSFCCECEERTFARITLTGCAEKPKDLLAHFKKIAKKHSITVTAVKYQ